MTFYDPVPYKSRGGNDMVVFLVISEIFNHNINIEIYYNF